MGVKTWLTIVRARRICARTPAAKVSRADPSCTRVQAASMSSYGRHRSVKRYDACEWNAFNRKRSPFVQLSTLVCLSVPSADPLGRQDRN